MEFKVILTGATGMVGEGVLLTCLQHPNVKQVLIVGRKPSGRHHQKLKECVVPDFFNLDGIEDQLTGYDACFYCAGISSVGIREPEYRRITYTTTLHFAEKLLSLNPEMVFSHISGSHTDSSEKGRVMWARIKGKTENSLMRMPFKAVYNFRPGFMKPGEGQQNVKSSFKLIVALYPILKIFVPGQLLTLEEVGLAMINSVLKGYDKSVLEIKDIKALSLQ
ncbi:NAD-dependent epimerase/dehydratase family protein [Pedobacter nyackensis]|uniref:NAD-dependent epimerase/dehydratase family protein n=1 Tax=Pedobacter nyackensis TaxID=475255 RepID=UPI002930A139|nr:NAD-dependent epimerase/dehydratase family protein [Pedobacter nyackensis]